MIGNNYIDEIIGQKIVKDILTKLIESSQIPHAFIFQGPDGVGKELAAIRFAQELNRKYTASSQAVKQIENLNEPYIKYIYPIPRGKNETESSSALEKLSTADIQIIQEELNKKILNLYYKVKIPKAQNIKINSIRDIKKFLSLSYGDIKYRIILISDAHLMNETAQNALLKNLEEPPAGVIFILVTPFPSLLRETIRSRCRILNFRPLNNLEIKKILTGHFNIEEEIAESVSPFADGSITSALSLIENDFEKLKEKTIFILRYAFGKKYHSALNEFSPLLSDGNSESIKILIQMMIVWLNDIQRFRYGKNDFFFKDYKETLEKFNNRFPNVELTGIVSHLNNLISVIKNNVNLNTIVLSLIYKLSSLTSPQLK